MWSFQEFDFAELFKKILKADVSSPQILRVRRVTPAEV
jgi:hypothetical protein